jgi:hypothetical protein
VGVWLRAKLPKILLGMALCFLALLVAIKALGAWVDRRLAQRQDTAYASLPKQWIPRGLYGGDTKQNTVRSVRKAFDRGARGVEIDFHYDPDRNDFFVSHDYPQIDAQGHRVYTKAEGRELPLEELMRETAADHYYWYDYKNLGHLDDAQTTRALARLEAITAIHGVKDRAYLEGSDPILLARYKRAGFRTILGIHPLAERWPGSSILIDLAKILYWFGGYDGIAIGYGTLAKPMFGPATRESLRHVPMFVFHVPPDRALVKELLALPQVRVLLVGRDVSVDLLDLEGCPVPPPQAPN